MIAFVRPKSISVHASRLDHMDFWNTLRSRLEGELHTMLEIHLADATSSVDVVKSLPDG